MDDADFLNDEILEKIDWDGFFDELPEDGNAFSLEPMGLPDSVSPEIDEIQTFLMNDDDGNNNSGAAEPSNEFCDSFFADILVNSPVEASGEVVDASSATDKDSSGDSDDGNVSSVKEKVDNDDEAQDDDDAADADDPTSKKRRRYC